jgi:hypothetical protein
MKDTEKAFHWIIGLLESKKIVYRIIGGFAARVYGSDRELADIDIEIADKDIPRLVEGVKPYIVFGPARYLDENWDLNLMTLQYLGQEIDLAGADAKIFNQKTKLWETLASSTGDIELKEVYNKKVPLESRRSLIFYKTKLAREVDLEDVRQISEQ